MSKKTECVCACVYAREGMCLCEVEHQRRAKEDHYRETREALNRRANVYISVLLEGGVEESTEETGSGSKPGNNIITQNRKPLDADRNRQNRGPCCV
jgi:hypothetical protein